MSDAVAQALLRLLAESAQPVSVPRLGKRLGLGASVVMRTLTLMGDSILGGQAGPGWVQLQCDDGRWLASLTAVGRQYLAESSHA
jgi:DNA-binding IclR family transcriptional regulator